MAGFTIIHLSDLHIGKKLPGVSQYLLNSLPDFTAKSLGRDFLEVEKKHSIPFRPEETLLVITGDITHQAEWQQYEFAIRFIRKLQSQFVQQLHTEEIPSDHIICIPGNHDIEVPGKKSDDTEMLRKTKYRNFKIFFDEITNHSSFANKFTLDNPFVNVHISVPFRIQILDLNTTLNVSSYLKEEEGAKARFTLKDLSNLDDILNIHDNAFRIALMHHPLEDFPSEDSNSGVSQNALRDWLISKDFKVVLCGHAHSARGLRFEPIPEESGFLELYTGYSFLQGQVLNDGNHYQIIRIEPSEENRISLVRRQYGYTNVGKTLAQTKGDWRVLEQDRKVLESKASKSMDIKVSRLKDIIDKTDHRNFIGIRSSQDWAVVAHCKSNKFSKFGVLSPGERVNANLLDFSGNLEGKLTTLKKTSKVKWDKYSGMLALFLVDSPHYNPYVRSILQQYGTYLAGGVIKFIDVRAKKPPLQSIQINNKRLTSNQSEGMKHFDKYKDYLLVMRLPGFVPRTGHATVEMPDIDRNRVIWVIAGIHSKASYAGAMIFTKKNLQLFTKSLQEEYGWKLPEYFEAVYEIPDEPARVNDFEDLERVHFRILRLKSEISIADDLPSGVTVRFLNKERWKTVPISVVHFDPVAACNFNCSKCIEKKVRRKKLFLSMNTCARILCDLKENGCQNLNFYGGEPTLHPNFVEILRLSSQLGFDMLLVTNGSRLCDERIIKAITSARNRIRVRVSIDAHSKESHQKNHGLTKNKDYYNSIVTNTEQLINSGVSVALSFLLHKDSIEDIDGFCNYWKAKRASAVILRPLTKQFGKSPELKYNKNKVDKLRAIINKKDNDGFVFTPVWFQNWINENQPPQKQQRNYKTCYSAYYRIAISPYNVTGTSQKVTVEDVEMTETSNAWVSLCTYRRYDRNYGCEYPDDLRGWCQTKRQETIKRINPTELCKGVVCCRHEYNKQIDDLIPSTV